MTGIRDQLACARRASTAPPARIAGREGAPSASDTTVRGAIIRAPFARATPPFRAETDRLAAVRTREVRVALAEEDRIPDGRIVGWAPAIRCTRGTRSASAGADPRRRHASLRFARHRRIHRPREPGVAIDTRTRAAAHRRQEVGSARRRHLRRGIGDRHRATPAGEPAKRRMDRAPARKIDEGVAELARELGERMVSARVTRLPTSPPVRARLPRPSLTELDWPTRSNLARLADKLGKRASFADTAPPAK